MATQAFAGPVNLTRADNASGQGSYKLDPLLGSGNVDLTATTSPTAVTNSITGNVVAYAARSFLCDVAGTFKFASADGSIDTWTVLAGVEYSMIVAYVFASGTSATGIHAIT